jgi:hypothetical protein
VILYRNHLIHVREVCRQAIILAKKGIQGPYAQSVILMEEETKGSAIINCMV